jgi:hypothetical protein
MAIDWAALSVKINNDLLATFGVGAIVTLRPQAGGSYDIDGVMINPRAGEDYQPGSIQGVTVVHYFVHFDQLDPKPVKGDKAIINGINYDVFDVVVDVEGGAVMKMRRYE